MRADTLELLTWISRGARTYPEAIEIWQTSCPRHSVWEDALADGLVRVVRNGAESYVTLTLDGEAAVELSSART
jgi:hypothetical protein